MTKTTALGILIAFSVGFLGYSLQKPFYNWDMIGYVASAMSWESEDPLTVQSRVYSLLKETVPQQKYEELTGGYDRLIRRSDPQSLWQHLPFYRIRVIYIAMIYMLFKLGVNPFFASHLISAVSACLMLWLVTFLFPRRQLYQYQVFVPLVSLLFGLSSLARYSTPDALAALTIALCYWLLLRRSMVLLLLLPISVLIRTDLMIVAILFVIYLFTLKRFDKRLVVLSAVVTVVLYLVVNSYFGYGWETTFSYTFVWKMGCPYPAVESHHVDVLTYLTALKGGLIGMVKSRRFVLYAVTVMGVGVLLWKNKNRQEWILRDTFADIVFVFLSALLYVAVHVAVFPMVATRFFSAQYILTACLLWQLLLEKRRFNKTLYQLSQVRPHADLPPGAC